MSALVEASGAHYVFGLSAGAVAAIETALVRPEITKLALYEPPLSFDGVVHAAWAPPYERELKAGKLGSALVTVMKATADRTAFRYVPRFLLAAPLNLVIRRRRIGPYRLAPCLPATSSQPCTTTCRPSWTLPVPWRVSLNYIARSFCSAAPRVPGT